MSLKEKISTDLKLAMKEGNTVKRDTLRMLDSMIKNVEIEKKKRGVGLRDEEVIEVITRAIKQRKDSAEQYRSGGRIDLVDKEEAEVGILMGYMPEQMGEEDARKEIRTIIEAMGSVSKADMGRVMGQAMAKLKGRVDGQTVKKIVDEELGS
jgi:uncharacterized protein